MRGANIERGRPGEALTGPAATAVRSLVTDAERHDGAPPLSEQFLLSVGGASPEGSPGVAHVVADDADGAVVGYAQSREGVPGEPPSAELVVAPAARRRGVGSALLEALPDDVRLWSHATTGATAQAAQAFAARRGLSPVRSLHVMHRLLRPADWGPAEVPDDLAVRSFEPGRDEDAFLAVNAAAFAHHPEQGSLRRADLDQRTTQPWWDPAGLLLLVDRSDEDRIAAFHWTKVDPPEGTRGEVYVVGVSPQRQGRGLGRLATVVGLDHLAARGLEDVVLYVDEENTAAVRTYARLGFTDLEVHRQYARPR